MELKWPVLVESRALRQDSGGPGQFRGGLGLTTQVRSLVEGRWSLAETGREKYPPWGLWNGKPGAPSDHLLRLPDEPDFKSVNIVRHWTPANSLARIVTAGGGGWGDPLERDPERVRWDVIEEYISLTAARQEYGVALHPDTFEIDSKETARLRAELRHHRPQKDNEEIGK
jgi:N-methylhydantoinase B